MENMHHININRISRTRTNEMADRVTTAADEARLLRKAGIDPRNWLARHVSGAVVTLGESLVRLGEGIYAEPEPSPCDDRLAAV